MQLFCAADTCLASVEAYNNPDHFPRSLDWSKSKMDQWSMVRPEAELL